MKKSYRVKKEKDFQTVFTTGKSIANRKFVIYQTPNTKEHYRLGLSVSKKLGNAVTRNRIKRRIRHIIMELDERLITCDFVVIARKGVESMDYQDMKKNLIHVLKLAKLYREGNISEKKD